MIFSHRGHRDHRESSVNSVLSVAKLRINMESISIIRSTFATLLRAWPLFLLYLLWTALFAPLGYLMLSIPEASTRTVVASALLAVVCALSFCALQAATAHWLARTATGERIGFNRAAMFDLARST